MLPGIIGRFVDVAVRQVTIEVPKGISLKERQKQLDLKRQLLRKCLAPVGLVLQSLSTRYETVAFLYIQGALARLQETHRSSFKPKVLVICISM